MAGVDKKYEGAFPMNSVEICGVPTISVGLTDPRADEERYEILDEYDREARPTRSWCCATTGWWERFCVGNIDRAGIYTGLIRDRVDVSSFKGHLLAGNFGLISLPKDYRKHLVVGDGIEV